jgi:hypothetical protein
MELRENFILTGAVTVTVAGLIYYLFRQESREKQSAPEEVPTEGGLQLEKSLIQKKMFIPTTEWQPVGDDDICPAGLEYKLNVYEGTKFARLPQ